ncbi:hypothetical protein CE143_24970 [Photorhabdus luminescens]|uniref:Uncharacterized protein n=1 Tax=Photorhabdus akhurstii TaxID=171438 RepID=A0ABX8M0R2_9GAMM|nr:hypothetical protein B0X70_24930 [Photorhabdus akhurstii]UJD77913.1 hypothetical protein CE143_24970 [Photorhabdus luminescens]
MRPYGIQEPVFIRAQIIDKVLVFYPELCFNLVCLVFGGEVFEAVTLRDTCSLSSIFMNYANIAINNSGAKS